MTVLMAGATAVRAEFYRRFARYLCAQGMRVICFDYRGIGSSLHGDVRATDARMRDWAMLDLAGMIDAIDARYPTTSLTVIGHSAGGQMIALADNNDRIDAALLVGAQNGYWRLWPRPRRYLLGALWHGLMPALTLALGYFPARRLGLGEDLPSGVATEWARWCRHSAYFVERCGRPLELCLNQFSQPVLSYSVEDDWMAPVQAVDALLDRFAQAQRERRHIQLADYGLTRLGHFGFFRASGREKLWPEALDWISAQ